MEIDDAELMLRIAGRTRCNGEEAAMWLGREECVESLLTIALFNMSQAGLRDAKTFPYAVDHVLETLGDEGVDRNIDRRRMQRLAGVLGGRFLSTQYLEKIRQAAEMLAQDIRTRNDMVPATA